MDEKAEFSIVIPCLNEEKTLPLVIKRSLETFKRLAISGEVLVVDNGSTDNSVSVAEQYGARVVSCPQKGYGNALRYGFSEAKGNFIIMGDADDSYHFDEIDDYVKFLLQGFDIVIGTRLKGKIEKGAMPFLHRYFGTPILTFLINIFFGTKISDCNCGMRGLTKSAFKKMHLTSAGMEFASEMMIKAGMLKLSVKEIPITLYRDKRDKAPHLHTWRDGWRHLKFILMFAPNAIFIVPGLFFFMLGTILMFLQLNGPFILGNIYMGIHSMILGLTCSIFGISLFQMGLTVKLFSVKMNVYYKKDWAVKLINKLTVEKGLIVGGLMFLVGVVMDAILVVKWSEHSFRDIFMPQTAIFGIYFIFIGIFLASFSFLQVIFQEQND